MALPEKEKDEESLERASSSVEIWAEVRSRAVITCTGMGVSAIRLCVPVLVTTTCANCRFSSAIPMCTLEVVWANVACSDR